MSEMIEGVSDRAGSLHAEMDLRLDSEDEVSLKGLVLVPLKRKRTILVCALVGLLTAILVSLAMTPRYRATALVELSGNEQGGVVGLDDLTPLAESGADEFKIKMQTEIAVMEDDSIALAVMSKLGMLRVGKRGLFSSGGEHAVSEDALTAKQREQLIGTFERHLRVEEVKSSRLIAVTYTSGDPVEAANVANQVVAEYKAFLLSANSSSAREISNWLAEQLAGMSKQARSSHELYHRLYAMLQEQEINSGSSVTNLTIADPARPPGTPWMPQPLLFAGAGLGGGLLFGLALAFFLESQDDTAADSLQVEAER